MVATKMALESVRDTQQATLGAQQAQIDALGAALRRQQAMMDEQAPVSYTHPTLPTKA